MYINWNSKRENSKKLLLLFFCLLSGIQVQGSWWTMEAKQTKDLKVSCGVRLSIIDDYNGQHINGSPTNVNITYQVTVNRVTHVLRDRRPDEFSSIIFRELEVGTSPDVEVKAIVYAGNSDPNEEQYLYGISSVTNTAAYDQKEIFISPQVILRPGAPITNIIGDHRPTFIDKVWERIGL